MRDNLGKHQIFANTSSSIAIQSRGKGLLYAKVLIRKTTNRMTTGLILELRISIAQKQAT